MKEADIVAGRAYTGSVGRERAKWFESCANEG